MQKHKCKKHKTVIWCSTKAQLLHYQFFHVLNTTVRSRFSFLLLSSYYQKQICDKRDCVKNRLGQKLQQQFLHFLLAICTQKIVVIAKLHRHWCYRVDCSVNQDWCWPYSAKIYTLTPSSHPEKSEGTFRSCYLNQYFILRNLIPKEATSQEGSHRKKLLKRLTHVRWQRF